MCLLAAAERCRAADLGLGLLTLLRQVRVLLCQLALLRRRALLGRQLQPSESQQLFPVAADGRVRASARVGGDALAEQRPPLIRGVACHHFSFPIPFLQKIPGSAPLSAAPLGGVARSNPTTPRPQTPRPLT